jgi:hypothetical protein
MGPDSVKHGLCGLFTRLRIKCPLSNSLTISNWLGCDAQSQNVHLTLTTAKTDLETKYQKIRKERYPTGTVFQAINNEHYIERVHVNHSMSYMSLDMTIFLEAAKCQFIMGIPWP